MLASPKMANAPLEPTQTKLLSLKLGWSTTMCVLRCQGSSDISACLLTFSIVFAAVCIFFMLLDWSLRILASPADNWLAASGNYESIRCTCPRSA